MLRRKDPRPVVRRTLLAVAVLCTLLLLAPARASASPLAGDWHGSYSCDRVRDAPFRLELGTDKGRLSGTFHFTTPDGPGAYTLLGRSADEQAFTLVPGTWLTRPAGYSALGLTGRLSDNGRQIAGSLQGCGLANEFIATRRQPDQADADTTASLPPAPPAGGEFDGLWQGTIGCSMNRRGQTEHYPVQARLFGDGPGLAGLFQVQIFKRRGQPEAGTFTQQVLLSGRAEAGQIRLERPLLLDKGGAGIDLRGLSATLAGERVTGTVQLNGCETITLARSGPTRADPLPGALAGSWSGTGGSRNSTALRLQLLPEAEPPFAELQLSYPADRSDPERDRLHLSLVALARHNDRLLLAPLGYREATGLFDAGKAQASRHLAALARGFVAGIDEQGGLRLWPVSNANELHRALNVPWSDAATLRHGYVLARTSADQAEALARGEAPPLGLGQDIGGRLAAAPSREAQCRELDAWIAPYFADRDPGRTTLAATTSAMLEAFTDPVFEPVFGLPYALTSQEDRSQLARFMLETCQRGLGMTRLGEPVQHAFRSVQGFTRVSSQLANVAEAAQWQEGSLAALPGLPEDEQGLQRIAALRREAGTRAVDLSDSRRQHLLGALDRREGEIRATLLEQELAGLEAGPGNDTTLGALGGWMTRLDDARLPADRQQPLLARARARAEAIAGPRYRAAAEQAARVPASLEGLDRLNALLRELAPVSGVMSRHFPGSEGLLSPLHRRRQALLADARVQAEFERALQQLPADADPYVAVQDTAARYLGQDRRDAPAAFAAIIDATLRTAEYRAIRLTDGAARPEPGEPGVKDIASVLYDRVQQYNSRLRELETRCLSGTVNDPITAMQCLGLPATLIGQGGMRARLTAVEKIGCTPEVPDSQYLCYYTQDMTVMLPGGSPVALDLNQLFGPVAVKEVTDARFFRQAGGGWYVIWGDL